MAKCTLCEAPNSTYEWGDAIVCEECWYRLLEEEEYLEGVREEEEFKREIFGGE